MREWQNFIGNFLEFYGFFAVSRLLYQRYVSRDWQKRARFCGVCLVVRGRIAEVFVAKCGGMWWKVRQNFWISPQKKNILQRNGTVLPWLWQDGAVVLYFALAYAVGGMGLRVCRGRMVGVCCPGPGAVALGVRGVCLYVGLVLLHGSVFADVLKLVVVAFW